MDRHTLFSMQAGLLVFLGLVIAVAYRARRRKMPDTSPYWFGVAYILGGIGLWIQAERDSIHSNAVFVLGMACFLLLSPLVHKAIAVITQQRGFFPYVLAVAATLFGVCLFMPPSPRAFLFVVLIFALGLALMQLSVVYLLLRSKEKVIRPATRTMAALLSIHVLASLLRALGAWHAKRADIWFSWTSILTIAGAVLCFLWIDNLRMSSELELQAMTDPLTNLLNRRGLDLFSAREIDMAVRNKWPCSALMIDIDDFKQINDRYGHTAGDTTLCSVAAVLNTTLRTSDLITRVGGDEFFVLLPNSDESTTSFVVSRIRLAIRALCLHSPGNETFSIHISIGQTTQHGHGINLAELLHAADIMLYSEKHRTQNNSSKRKVFGQRKQDTRIHPSNS